VGGLKKLQKKASTSNRRLEQNWEKKRFALRGRAAKFIGQKMLLGGKHDLKGTWGKIVWGGVGNREGVEKKGNPTVKTKKENYTEPNNYVTVLVLLLCAEHGAGAQPHHN